MSLINRRHVFVDHAERGVTEEEVEQAITDPRRLFAWLERSDRTYGTVIGQTAAGRLLFVAYVERPDGRRYPVHVRDAGPRLGRRYSQR